MRERRIVMLVAIVAVAAGSAGTSRAAIPSFPRPAASYPYRSAAFTQFLTDSYREAPSPRGTAFYDWFEQAYATSPARLPAAARLSEALTARAAALKAAAGPSARAREEIETATWLYRLIKTTIPRFSLARGYEFVSAVRFGERQCLLQSVLIAGLLQAAGVDAGVAMVWKNMAGRESNNGHAVTIVRLADGRDVEIDASEHQAVATHQGLFATDGRRGAYRFLEPAFDREGLIISYRPAGRGSARLRPRDVQPLSVGFLRSQFYYYRGEQSPGGLVNGPATTAGLRNAAHYLEIARRLDPQNPLAVYMLGRVYLRLGRGAEAKARLIEGYGLYAMFGHVPEGPRAAYAAAGRM